jgi:hypothetical protein
MLSSLHGLPGGGLPRSSGRNANQRMACPIRIQADIYNPVCLFRMGFGFQQRGAGAIPKYDRGRLVLKIQRP